MKGLKKNGIKGIIHGNRGKESNNKIDKAKEEINIKLPAITKTKASYIPPEDHP